MNLYIQIENEQTVNHPAFEDNLIAAFGGVPEHWKPFVRVERPTLGVYEVLESEQAAYQMVNGVWTDVWTVRDMTAEEVADVNQKIARARQSAQTIWASRRQAENWSAWIFDEVTCEYNPPIPRPAKDQTKIDAGILTMWCGAENNWKDTPVRLNDGNDYIFDFFAWIWVAL